MERTRVNITVGLFVVLGVLALGYLSVKLGRVSFLGGGGYVVFAEFPSVGGLKPGSTVEIAGVEVGRVESIGLKNYEALVTLRINSGVKLPESRRISSSVFRYSCSNETPGFANAPTPNTSCSRCQPRMRANS